MVFYNLITLILTYITHILVSISYVQSRNVSFDPLIVRETHSLQILGRHANWKQCVAKNMRKHRFALLSRWKLHFTARRKVDNLYIHCYAECNFYCIKHLLHLIVSHRILNQEQFSYTISMQLSFDLLAIYMVMRLHPFNVILNKVWKYLN